ncbi:MAG TPA: hypothetical protein VFH73_15325 [Polyangia bacterium]|nr:hypothetical protein [Polyangia bacterium]
MGLRLGPAGVAALFVVVGAVVVSPNGGRGARAGTCLAPAGTDARLQAVDGRARLAWIDQRLSAVAAQGRLWTWGWAIGIGAAGVASLVPVPFVSAGDRVDWYAGAASAAIGVVPFLLSPLSVTHDGPKLHAAVMAAAPLDDDGRVCTLLADAEWMLAADAANQRWQQGWWIHAGNIAFNTGVMLFLGLGYHHWTSGIINGVAGAAVGETIIFTQPTGSIDDLAAYQRGELGGGAARASDSSPAWRLVYRAMF